MSLQDGEVVYVDWMPQKDQDSGKLQSEIFCLFVLSWYNTGLYIHTLGFSINNAYLGKIFTMTYSVLSLAPKPDFYHTIHDGPVITIERSPFFKDIILCIGGWNFTIWKEGTTVSSKAMKHQLIHWKLEDEDRNNGNVVPIFRVALSWTRHQAASVSRRAPGRPVVLQCSL